MSNNIEVPNINGVPLDESTLNQAIDHFTGLASNQSLEMGLNTLESKGHEPLAYVDVLGQVWPHEPGSPTRPDLNYVYTQAELNAALRDESRIIVAQHVAPVLQPVIADANVPLNTQAVHAMNARRAMLTSFRDPAGRAAK